MLAPCWVLGNTLTGRKGMKRQEMRFSPSPASHGVASGRWLPSISLVSFNWDEHTYTINIWGHKLQCPLEPGKYLNEWGGSGESAVSGRAHGQVQGWLLKSASLQWNTVGPVWPDLMVSLRGVESLGFYVTSYPSHLPKPQLHKGKIFVSFFLCYSLSP